MNDTVLLDFCRVKKIDEKGFGFLKSLHYPGDVFFHFTQIKKEDFLEKLQKMKRGEFIVYFVSRQRQDGKRKAEQIWYSLKDVPASLIPSFKEKIITEFNGGRTNLFDLLYVFDEMRQLGILSVAEIEAVLRSSKIKSLPTTILPYLSTSELLVFSEILEIEKLMHSSAPPFWLEEVQQFIKRRVAEI